MDMCTECEMRELKNKYCNAPVWYNSNLKIGNKCVFFQKWYLNGVKTIGDFISVDGGLISKTVFQQNFNLSYVCTMQYNSIISVISKYLKYLAVDRTTPMKGSQPTCSLPYYFETIIPN